MKSVKAVPSGKAMIETFRADKLSTFSKAKPFRSPRLISLNSFRNVAAHRKVFAPFLFIGFDLQNEYLFFPVFSVAASLSFTLSCSDSQLRIELRASLVIYHLTSSTP